MEATIALAGNPNCGKTTLFNVLTGARQHVSNYPGVTVEKKEGLYLGNGHKIHIVDLPGTYSLTAYSLEEVVARDYLVHENPALVINILDASNLERNLYLSVQFLEMGIPVCMALNMMDVAKNRGVSVDSEKLSSLLGVPVIPTVARNGKGTAELMDAAVNAVQEKRRVQLKISYGEDMETALMEMEREIRNADFLAKNCLPRWVALKYLERDSRIMEIGDRENPDLSAKLKQYANRLAEHLQKTMNMQPEAVIADHRYGYINTLVHRGVVQRQDNGDLYLSDRVDQVLTHRVLGPVIMLAVVMALYQFTFTFSEIPVGWFDSLFGWLSALADAHMADGLLKSLVISGVIDGVGGVIGFTPLILFMFLGISFLEDSGYLARVAYMLDRVFRIFGLHGSSVMAFIVSGGIAGGCAVPGVMATRTLKSPREQLATLLTVPFMNCGAKLPVFALLTAAFFAENEARVMMLLTVISWGGALLVARLLRSTVIRGESTPFVMELPPYRLPTIRGLLMHTWERTWQYIRKAGTILLAISIILWAMMTFPGLPESDVRQFEAARESALAAVSPAVAREATEADGETELSPGAQALADHLAAIDAQEAEDSLRHSIAGRIGMAMEPLSQWAGFNWRTNIALVGGFAAKEVIVATLGTAYSLGEVDPEESGALADTLRKAPGWSPLTAVALIIFTIFYAPCCVTVVCIAKESGSWKWAFFSMAFNTVLAFSLATGIYQIGTLMGYGA